MSMNAQVQESLCSPRRLMAEALAELHGTIAAMRDQLQTWEERDATFRPGADECSVILAATARLRGHLYDFEADRIVNGGVFPPADEAKLVAFEDTMHEVRAAWDQTVEAINSGRLTTPRQVLNELQRTIPRGIVECQRTARVFRATDRPVETPRPEHGRFMRG